MSGNKRVGNLCFVECSWDEVQGTPKSKHAQGMDFRVCWKVSSTMEKKKDRDQMSM